MVMYQIREPRSEIFLEGGFVELYKFLKHIKNPKDSEFELEQIISYFEKTESGEEILFFDAIKNTILEQNRI